MSLVLQVPCDRRLVIFPLLTWDPLEDTATILDAGNRKVIKLSTSLPFSKAACQQIKAKPEMLSMPQAKALLAAAAIVRIEQRLVTQVTKTYRDMLRSVAAHHGLPPVSYAALTAPPAPKKSQTKQIEKSRKTSSRKQENAAHVGLTPYQIRCLEDEQARRQRRIREEHAPVGPVDIRMTREMQAAVNAHRRQEAEIARQRRVLAEAEQQRTQKRKVDEDAARFRQEARREQLTSVAEVRKSEPRAARLYRRIDLSEMALPPRLGDLRPLRFNHWLPDRLEVEVETDLGAAFVPLAVLLSFDSRLCGCLQQAMGALTLEESLELLRHCLSERNFHSTPPAMQLLEGLHDRLSRSAKRNAPLRPRIAALTPQLRWRQQRCAEKYGYRAAELAQSRAERADALLERVERETSKYSAAQTAFRVHEWGSEQGITHFNPFEYK